MNKVELVGRLTKDIELRTTQTGKSVCRFTIAVNRIKKDEADFISCVAWNGVAELLSKYVLKGDRIAIIGRINTSSYENEQGETVYRTDVIAEDIFFLENRRDKAEPKQEKAPAPEPAPKPEDFFGAVDDEDLPF